jgi:hypothetical protein
LAIKTYWYGILNNINEFLRAWISWALHWPTLKGKSYFQLASKIWVDKNVFKYIWTRFSKLTTFSEVWCKQKSIQWKLAFSLKNWCLRFSNVELNKKTVEKYHHASRTFLSVEVSSNDEGIKDLKNITRVIMKRKKNQ